jgi:hypothetical protein
LRTLWRTTHLTILHISNHQTSRFYDHHTIFFSPFSIIFGNKRFSNGSSAWMLDLWSSRQTVLVQTWSSRWILSSAVTFAAVVVWFLDTFLFNVRQSLSLSFGFRPQFLLADGVFTWFVYAVTTLETTALEYTW